MMEGGNRGRQVYRLICLLNIIHSHPRRGVTADELVRMLWDALDQSPDERVSLRTVQRDLRFLVKQAQWVRHVAPRYYPADVILDGLKVGTTYDEMLSVFLAENLLALHADTPVLRGLSKLAQKFRPLLTPGALDLLVNMQDAFVFKGAPSGGRPDPAIVDQLHFAIQKGLTVRLRYRSIHWDDAREAEYDPHAIVYYRDTAYLVADSHYRRERGRPCEITLRIGRIESLTMTDRTFRRRSHLAVRNRLNRVIGVYLEHKPMRYRVRLNAFARRLVEEEPWHEAQQIEPTEDGGGILTLDLDSDMELTPLVLSLGAGAEVLEPVAYRTKIAEVAWEMARRYAASDRSRGEDASGQSQGEARQKHRTQSQ